MRLSTAVAMVSLVAVAASMHVAYGLTYTTDKSVIPFAMQCLTGEIPNASLVVNLENGSITLAPSVADAIGEYRGNKIYCVVTFSSDTEINAASVRGITLLYNGEPIVEVAGISLEPANTSGVAVLITFNVRGGFAAGVGTLLDDAYLVDAYGQRVIRARATANTVVGNTLLVSYNTSEARFDTYYSDSSMVSLVDKIIGAETPLIQVKFDREVDVLVDNPSVEFTIAYKFTYNVSEVAVRTRGYYDHRTGRYITIITVQVNGGEVRARLERFIRPVYIENTVIEFTADVSGIPTSIIITKRVSDDKTIYLPCSYRVEYTLGSLTRVRAFCPFIWEPTLRTLRTWHGRYTYTDVAIVVNTVTSTMYGYDRFSASIRRVLLVGSSGVYDLGRRASIVYTTYDCSGSSGPMLAALFSTTSCTYTTFIYGEPVARIEAADESAPAVHIEPRGPVAAVEVPPPPLGNVSVPQLRPRVPAVTTPEGVLFYSGLLAIYIWMARRMGWETAMIPMGMVVTALGAASGSSAAQLGGLLAVLAGVLLLAWRRG